MLTIGSLLIAMILAAVTVYRPRMVMHNGGLAFGFVALFVMPLLATGMGTSAHVERSKTTQFCTSCHVMAGYGQSLMIDDITHIPAKHYQNGRVPKETACYSCHTTYTMYGDLHAKMRGLRHVWVQYFGHIPEKVKLYSSYNNRECLHCHSGSRGFEETSAHHEEAASMDRIRKNELSCLASGCHSVTHDVSKLASFKKWSLKEQNR
jgi:nitrate/TMAO reductase-like tetraheme cytochrome c subunit